MPMNYYYGFDYTWYLLVLPAFLLALWAQLRVKTTYAKYSKIRSARGRTAAEVARQILNDHGLTYVRVDQIAGELTDNYDPAPMSSIFRRGSTTAPPSPPSGSPRTSAATPSSTPRNTVPCGCAAPSSPSPISARRSPSPSFCGITAEFYPADEHRHPAVRAGDAVPAHHPSGRIQCQPAGACHHRGTRAAYR